MACKNPAEAVPNVIFLETPRNPQWLQKISSVKILKVCDVPEKMVIFIFTVTLLNVYRFLPRDARSAMRGTAIVSRPSVCLSVRNVDVPWAYVLG